MIGRGRFDRRITFQRAAEVEESMGGTAPGSWEDITQAYAMVRFGTAQERREAAAESASQAATFRVLSTAAMRGVTESDRIQFDGRAWDITGIAPIGVAEELEFTATVAKG